MNPVDSVPDSISPASVQSQRPTDTGSFTWNHQTPGETLSIVLGGRATIADAPEIWKRVTGLLEEQAPQSGQFTLELKAVESMDGACVALLVHLQSELKRRGLTCEFRDANEELSGLLQLHRRRGTRRRAPRPPRGTFDQIGEATLSGFLVTKSALNFFGELLLATGQQLRKPSTANPRDLTLIMERAGADAVPIVALINFLVGFVVAFQSAPQLQQFGAGAFLADLIGLAMVRELAPLMTAIIVCGRSGAAFAAELSTMSVSEEVDALKTLGLLPLRYLVLPRVLGLVLVVPLLTLLGDAVGILGGMLVSLINLGLTPEAFFSQLSRVLRLQDVASGLFKSAAFGFTIALIACERGLSATGGASEVGRRTTSSVVITLFALVSLDALFTLLLKTFDF
jgi:phospholipid/cholesterol/gamma-HCH transport system permease protein